ncbi:DUF5723 family protein [Fulvivirgaceae bacterium BMA10]|uniref:DUF5723 family protein n=1 Tax=Splendidivirga corallicola TaxID=3051826 RepID=A0ABT8KI96_9BACT|nr:DUF5723 family protein [Fulvivirgaceae bacterium BMA10]
MKKIIIAILMCGTFSMVHAQQEVTFHFMRAVPQSTYNNPAFIPKHDTYIGLFALSSIHASVLHSGFSYDDVIRRLPSDSLRIDLLALQNAIKNKNYIINEEDIDLFSMGFRVNPKMYLSLNLSAKNYQVIQYTDDLINLLIDGNAAYLSEPLNLEIKANGMSYIDAGVGLSYQVNDKLVVGSKVKYLTGLLNVTTKQANLSLETGEFYELTIAGDAHIQTSGINEITNGDFDPDISDIKDYFSNNGLGIDIGATYQISDRINVGLSVLDIGSIKWKNDVREYMLTSETSEFTWRGINVDSLINGNAGNEIDQMVDSLENNFDFREDSLGTYKSALPMRIYLSGSYRLPYNVTLGAVLFNEKFRDFHQIGGGVVVNKGFGKTLDLSLSYSVKNNSYNNLGFGLAARLIPPLQLYIASDNLLSTSLKPNSAKGVNLRFGLNFVYNWHKTPAAIPSSLR